MILPRHPCGDKMSLYNSCLSSWAEVSPFIVGWSSPCPCTFGQSMRGEMPNPTSTYIIVKVSAHISDRFGGLQALTSSGGGITKVPVVFFLQPSLCAFPISLAFKTPS